MSKDILLNIAKEIAVRAHKGQKDKAGVNYISPEMITNICFGYFLIISTEYQKISSILTPDKYIIRNFGIKKTVIMVPSLSVEEFLQSAEQGVIIDVRTPAEYALGHIVGAVNIPLFTDEQRAVVGTIYKQIGRDEAVEKGLEFVGPKMALMVKEAKKISQGRTICVYCWRGGMRSGSVAWLFSTAGLPVKLLKGGYKAYRGSFEKLLSEHKWQINLLSGPTGCGKTELLHHIAHNGEQVLDLEGLANHKGSAFGALGEARQPSTEHFINLIHHRLRCFDPSKPVWCEGESMLIGHVFIPSNFYQMMKDGRLIEVRMDIEQRLDRLIMDYGKFPVEDLIAAFTKIRKRLGYDKAQQAIEFLKQNQIREAARIALWYYDKSYTKSGTEESRSHLTEYTVENTDMRQSAASLINMMKK